MRAFFEQSCEPPPVTYLFDLGSAKAEQMSFGENILIAGAAEQLRRCHVEHVGAYQGDQNGRIFDFWAIV
jgi:hypothetical protein